MSDRRGLPTVKKMRHDAHFVDALTTRFEESVGRRVAVSSIVANPLNPRMEMGEIDDLVESIRERGILQPLLVTPLEDGRYQLVAGERRFRAAQKAGLKEIPVIEIEGGEEEELLVVALVENLQRKDLTPFEEGDGLRLLGEKFGFSQEEISHQIGKKRSTVSESLKIAAIPAEIRGLCDKAGIETRTLLLQIAREGDPNRMLALIDRIAAGERVERDKVSAERRHSKGATAPGRPKFFSYSFRPKESNFALSLRFKKSRVSRDEVIAALREALERILSEKE